MVPGPLPLGSHPVLRAHALDAAARSISDGPITFPGQSLALSDGKPSEGMAEQSHHRRETRVRDKAESGMTGNKPHKIRAVCLCSGEGDMSAAASSKACAWDSVADMGGQCRRKQVALLKNQFVVLPL